MLAADKQLLDAQLRNHMQELRMLEITNIVNRFQSALTPATLIAGFCFSSIVEIDIIRSDEVGSAALFFEPVFYVTSSIGLALALYVVFVSSMGIIFGQRLTVQATAAQGQEHDKTVKELNNKFMLVLIALGSSMVAVVLSAVAVVWVKDPSGEGRYGTFDTSNCIAISTSVITALVIVLTAATMLQMSCRLHTTKPADARIMLRTSSHPYNLSEVTEFYVTGGDNLQPGPATAPPLGARSKSFGTSRDRGEASMTAAGAVAAAANEKTALFPRR